MSVSHLGAGFRVRARLAGVMDRALGHGERVEDLAAALVRDEQRQLRALTEGVIAARAHLAVLQDNAARREAETQAHRAAARAAADRGELEAARTELVHALTAQNLADQHRHQAVTAGTDHPDGP